MKSPINKNILYILYILLFLTEFISAQNEIPKCETEFSEEQINYLSNIRSELAPYEKSFLSNKHQKENKSTRIVNSIPLKAHIVRNSDGQGGLSFSELDDAINNLNQIFYDSNLEFFLADGINFIDNDELYHFQKGEENELVEAYNISGLVNIYFTNNLKNTSNLEICGFSDNTRNKDYIIIKNECATNRSSLAHEMGHMFSLIHTHGNDNDSLTAELVDGSNCDTTGDGICDTPADPKLSTENVNNFCEYIGVQTDIMGNVFNPDTANIMSYSKKACRTHFTEEQLARMYAFYITQKNYLSDTSFNADIIVNETQTCDETLIVNFNTKCVGITNWQWDIDSDGIIDYTSKNPTHTFKTGVYNVTLIVSKGSNTISKTFPHLIKVGTQTRSLFDENFNGFEIAGEYGWSVNDVANSGYKWLTSYGETSTKNTGPIHDKTDNDTSFGKYIYAEASGSNPGDIAEFISPCIDVVYENSEMQFSYHMFGEDIGELHIDIKTSNGYIIDVIPPIIGSQQISQNDDFITKSVNLSSYLNETINIRFRAVRGDGWEGDIAIDDVFINTITTPISDESIKLYPNPIKNNAFYIKRNNTDETLFYEISNLVGQKFDSGVVSNQPINVSNLNNGTYLLTLIGDNSRVIKKFIK
ncbi:M43 family zinc metalloprotease [Seonamhaeicola sp. MEBiC1930]|uniref:M43 family zinc metalloprotease n=1 Tax=Seonamhaeicola sp. MEBiC01930 TaxID=2976768 RepID=UPI0032517B30